VQVAPTDEELEPDLERSLTDWRRFRKRRRVAEINVIDALYRADIAFLLGGAAVYLLAGAIGDGAITRGQAVRVAGEGADWLCVVTAAVVAVGLRSGSRGGPLVLEQAEVRHVLLAPVDRTAALRGPALRQLRFLLFVAGLAGMVVGNFASHRLEHHAAAWTLAGGLYALATMGLAYGVALCAAAWRVRPWIATGLGFLLVGHGAADAWGWTDHSPLAPWGRVGMWPYGFGPLGLVALVVTAAVLVVGLLRIGDVSVEAAERRSTLVGQIRFAATLQDLRTVIVLRRQLALELPRLRPWVRVRGRGRFPVWTRGWQGALRWPAARVGRVLLLAGVAGLSLRSVWSGTTPMVLVAGLALFLVGLDAVESLGQETDHPSRAETAPHDPGQVHVRHLPAAVAITLAVAAVGIAAALVIDPQRDQVAIAAVCAVPAALGAVAGGAVSVLGGEVNVDETWTLVAPEAAGMGLALRTAIPPALAVAGTLPVLAARAAVEQGRAGVPAAAVAGVGVLALFGLVATWVRLRHDIRAWLSSRVERQRSRGRTAPASVEEGA
jgi:hypothetical protein